MSAEMVQVQNYADCVRELFRCADAVRWTIEDLPELPVERLRPLVRRVGLIRCLMYEDA